MQIIMDENAYREIWDRFYAEFGFEREAEQWVKPALPHKMFKLRKLWTEEQERTVCEIFCRLCSGEMFALDWQHDCFIFSPEEHIPLYYQYYDLKQDCTVYFPSFFPNGDFHFFLSADWQLGLFGHPWREEICVMGTALTAEFEMLKDQLDLAE